MHVLMFTYTTDDDLGSTRRTVAIISEEAGASHKAAPDVDAAVTIVIRSYVAGGAVIGLVPLPIGTSLILTANGAFDLAVPQIAAPFVPSASVVANTTWCTTYVSGASTTISCVDLSTYDPYMVRCEASAASRNALVYRGKPFSCQVYLAPFATAPAPITAASRQLLYNASADAGVTVSISVTRAAFRGTVDVDFVGTDFRVSYCVQPSGLWSCYRAVVDVANLDDLLMPWNSSDGDSQPGQTTKRSGGTAPSAPPSKTSTTAGGPDPPTLPPSNVSDSSALTSTLTTTPATTILTTRVTNALDALPPLTPGTDASITSAGGNITLSSGPLTAEVFRPASPSSGSLRLVPTNRSANFSVAPRVNIELTLSQPGIGAFVLDTARDGPLTVSRDAAQGLFTVSGPAGAVRDALPWLRFGFSPSAAGRNDTTVTVALTADGGPRQTMVVRVSDVAEINTAPKAIGVTPPATLVFAGRAFVALLPTTILDAG